MANTISTYDELADAIKDTTKITEDAGRFIALAEKHIFRNLRVYEMEAETTITASSGVVSVPTDFVALKRLSDVGEPEKIYQQTNADTLYRFYEDATDLNGGYFVQEADKLEIRPKPGTSQQYDIVYWTRPSELGPSTQTNDIFPEYADLYYNLACSYAFKSRKDFEAGREYRSEYSADLQEANAEAERAQSSGALHVRPPVSTGSTTP